MIESLWVAESHLVQWQHMDMSNADSGANIGCGSKIGAMALVLESVPPNSVVASKPAELLVKGGEALLQHEELTQGWNGEMDYQI